MTNWKQRWITSPHPIVVSVLFVVSLMLLWHSTRGAERIVDPQNGTVLAEGVITSIDASHEVPASPSVRTTTVQELSVRLDDDRIVAIENDLTPLNVGEHIYLTAWQPGTSQESYTIIDYKRVDGLMWLAVGFVIIVVAVSGFRKGLYALVGTLFSVGVLFGYALPALAGGAGGFTVGLATGALILAGTFYVSYGFNRMSLSALIGIVVTLLLAGAIGAFVVHTLHFTGFGDEAAVYLNQETDNGVDLVGLLIAGILIAAVGVLDDVAVTQASTTFELAQASSARGWHLFRHAMRVGTDHISAVINTLVLAYAGASLPLIVLLYTSRFPLGFTLGGEQIAQEVVRTLVSSAALVLAVPLTTAVAVFAVHRWGPGHGGAHSHT